MWPPGHAAVAYVLYTASTRTRFDARPARGPALAVAFGSQFSDLVDKPLAWYAGALPTGRTLAHSLLVLLPLAVAAYRLADRYGRGEDAVAFAVGAVSHSLVDALPALWTPDGSVAFLLWPLLPVEPYETGAPTVLGLLRESLWEPAFLVEFALLTVALVLWYRDGLPGLAWPGTGPRADR